MAYIVGTKRGTWEIRESQATPKGPRSRTLASFRELNEEVLERALSRASKPFELSALRLSALRTGAPVAERPADRAAVDLLRELAVGHKPRSALQSLVADALGAGGAELSDAARAAGEWVAATPEQRGDALRDLLLLVDRLPAPKREPNPRFPRLQST
jgi:hypothetical protein